MTITSLRDIHKPLHLGSKPFYGLTGLRRAIEVMNINIEPDFQRGRVWSLANKQAFVGHLLSGGAVQPLILNTGPDGDFEKCELIDGKQRLLACIEWVEGHFPAKLLDGREIVFADLDKYSRTVMSNRIGLEFGQVRLTRLEMLELYLKLNSGGVPHTAKELNKVRKLVAQEKGPPCP